MKNRSTLIFSGTTHSRVHAHLFPGDGLEAAAILLCTRMDVDQTKLLVKSVILVPYDECNRVKNFLNWPGNHIEDAIDLAEVDDLSIVLIHSHPGGLYDFSQADDVSDAAVIPSLFLARDRSRANRTLHGSAVMVSGGGIRARIYDETMQVKLIDLVAVYGNDIRFYWSHSQEPSIRPLAFSDGMTEELKNISATVVGISGTGSIVAEQLARMGFGSIVVVDFDRIEKRNLNRILNSSVSDCEFSSLKVDVFSKAVSMYQPETTVHSVPLDIATKTAIRQSACSDILFCCVDSEIGRSICDAMASSFLQPLFDVGVVIPVRNTERGHAILDINGRVDYVQPGGSTLLDRNVYSPASIAAEYLSTTDPKAYADRVNEGYMPGAMEQAPSVITVNMRAASMCVQEFIARAYCYRLDGNNEFARSTFSLAAGEDEYKSEECFNKSYSLPFAVGLKKPLLGMPAMEESP